MDYSKVTFVEYQAKKKAILNSLGRIEGMCYGIKCEDCIFHTDRCNVSDDAEITSPLEAIKKVMDYEIPVDWSKVKVDTPVYVRDFDAGNWRKRHFAKYQNGIVFVFSDGRTSWTTDGVMSGFRYNRLIESEEINNEK